MDLSKLSDADLAAIAARDMSKVSPDGLAMLAGRPQTGPQEPVSPKPELAPTQQASTRSVPNQLARALGLVLRSGAEGLAETAQLVTEPIRAVQDLVTPSRPPSRTSPIKGESIPPKSLPLGMLVSGALDNLGLPRPENAVERVGHETSKLLTGTAGLAKGAAALAERSTGPLSQVFTALSSSPVQQVTSAAGAGLAGGAAKEQGGGALSQVGASLAGGVAGGLVPNMASKLAEVSRAAVRGVRNEFGFNSGAMQADNLIRQALQQAGVDYSKVPERVRQGMRADIIAALDTGQTLNPEAMSRLLDFRRIGATPTVGGVTQNPVTVTREMNLAKTGANTGDEALHGLAQIQNQNNKVLIRNLNEAGELPGDLYEPGRMVMSSIASIDRAKKANVSALYNATKELAGGDIPLARKPFVDNIFGALIRENKLNFLPESVGNMLNTISKGQIVRDGQTHAVPFTADTLDTLMTVLATEQRATQNGNVKRALALAREALDATPLQPLKNTIGSNTVVTEGAAGVIRAMDAQPAEYLKALNTARAAAKARFDWQESAKPIEDALSGAAPDTFLKKHLLSPGSTLEDAKSIAAHADTKAVRDAILLHLKDRAVGGAKDDVAKFSQSNYNRALRDLGDRKLALFFDKDELEHLKTVGRAASYMQVQPAGSAVGNSNTGAYVMGKMYDGLKAGLSHVPGVGPVTAGLLDTALGNPTKRVANWTDTRSTLDIGRGVMTPKAKPTLMETLMLPATAAAGSLAPASE